MTLKSVVLPAPFGPIRATSPPASTLKDTRSSATTPPKRTLRSRTSRSDTQPNTNFGPSPWLLVAWLWRLRQAFAVLRFGRAQVGVAAVRHSEAPRSVVLRRLVCLRFGRGGRGPWCGRYDRGRRQRR